MMSASGSATSRSSSPAGQSDVDSPQHLTPRSKVRALLDAIDAESDSGAEAQSNLIRQNASISDTISNRSHDHKRATRDCSDASSAEDDITSFKARVPWGKLAARLQGHILPDPEQELGREVGTDREGHKKISKMPMGKSVEQPFGGHASETTHTLSEAHNDDDSETETEPGRQPTPMRRKSLEQSLHSSLWSNRPFSPGLLPTPENIRSLPRSPMPSRDSGSGSDSDANLPAAPEKNSQFLALVARKREERAAKAKAEALKEAERYHDLQKLNKSRKENAMAYSGDSEDDAEAVNAYRLTQQAKPTRKASKKALEEMSRETQRMSRNMQLAHQARTKKKITKESFFARFNYNSSAALGSTSVQNNNSSSAAPSSVPVSEAEADDRVQNAEVSPPTSPLTPNGEPLKQPIQVSQFAAPVEEESMRRFENNDEELPDALEIIQQAARQEQSKGKGQAPEQKRKNSEDQVNQPKPRRHEFTDRPIRVRPPKLDSSLNCGGGSDSDIEIIHAKQKPSKKDLFHRLPAGRASEGHSLQTLRALAHLTSPGKQKSSSKAGMSLSDMQQSLQMRARQQAARERAEKIQDLKDRGIIVQTAEERQKDQAEVEDLLEKARREATELKQKEKIMAKKQTLANGEANPGSSEDDEDYEDNDADESDMELSGSDQEESANEEGSLDELDKNIEEDIEEGVVTLQNQDLIDGEASETSDDENNGDQDATTEDISEDGEKIPTQAPRRTRKARIIEDDEDEDIGENRPEALVPAESGSKQPANPGLLFAAGAPMGLSQAFEATLADTQTQQPMNPGLPGFAGVPMGMTQAFAATMADTQTQANPNLVTDQEQDSLLFLGPPPEPDFPIFDLDESTQMVADSQEMTAPRGESQGQIRFNFSQSQLDLKDTQEMEDVVPMTQGSQMPDPSQDVGFALSSPAPVRFVDVPPSTVDTVILPRGEELDSPILKKKGRLMRKTNMALSDGNGESAKRGEQDYAGAPRDAFDALKKASKEALHVVDDFDKKKSSAKEMVEEQAQESEDEYAGLGGASDEESGGEEDEEFKKMIDHDEINVDENELAAFYA